MHPLDLVKLTALMELSQGKPTLTVGLIDGPVAVDHPDLGEANIREAPGGLPGRCTQSRSAACAHGTFVAGIVCARRRSAAPAICPGCTLLVRPIFPETVQDNERMPSATPQELATALVECIDAGARVLNISAALVQPSSQGERALDEALDYAMRAGVIVVVAAGNQGTVGSTALTRHPWVIPVIGCDPQGRPLALSNVGSSIGRRGLSAPGEAVTSLTVEGRPRTAEGTSVAAPFVTATVALLWSEFPTATAAEVKRAVTQAASTRRPTLVPPLLDAWAAFQAMAHRRETGR